MVEESFEIFIGDDNAAFTRDQLLPFPFFESHMTNCQQSSTTIRLGPELELSFGIADLTRLVDFTMTFTYKVLLALTNEDLERFAACARYMGFQVPVEKRHEATVAFAAVCPSPVITKLLYDSTGIPTCVEPPPDELQEKMLRSYLKRGQQSWIIDQMSPEFKCSGADEYLCTLLTQFSSPQSKPEVSAFTEQYQRCTECIGEGSIPQTARKLSELVRARTLASYAYQYNGRGHETVQISHVGNDLRSCVFRTILDDEGSSEIRQEFLTSQLWETLLVTSWDGRSLLPSFRDDDFELFMDILPRLSEEEFAVLAEIAREFIVAYKQVPGHQKEIWRTLGNIVWAGVQVC